MQNLLEIKLLFLTQRAKQCTTIPHAVDLKPETYCVERLSLSLRKDMILSPFRFQEGKVPSTGASHGLASPPLLKMRSVHTEV